MFTHPNLVEKTLAILVVDDNTVNRKVASKAVSNVLGISVVSIKEASDINSAAKALEEQIKKNKKSFDFIVMDFEMPGGNGDTVTLKLHDIEDANGVKPGFIFSWSTVRNWPGGEAGKPYEKANAILEKPIKLDNLKSVLIDNGFGELLSQQPPTSATPRAG